jgi:hypothetical protein
MLISDKSIRFVGWIGTASIGVRRVRSYRPRPRCLGPPQSICDPDSGGVLPVADGRIAKVTMPDQTRGLMLCREIQRGGAPLPGSKDWAAKGTNALPLYPILTSVRDALDTPSCRD